MTTQLRRRSLCRRHSISTLPNVEKNYSKEITFQDDAKALKEPRPRDCNREYAKRRRLSTCLHGNIDGPTNCNDELHKANTVPSYELFSTKQPFRIPSVLKHCQRNISTQNMYESTVDTEVPMDVNGSNLSRRKKRSYSTSHDTVNENWLPVPSGRLGRHCKRQNNPNEIHAADDISMKKHRKISATMSQSSKQQILKSTNLKTTNLIENCFPKDKNLIQFQEYYFLQRTSLETIHEENISLEGLMSNTKIKRFRPFQDNLVAEEAKKAKETIMMVNSRRRKSIDVAIERMQDINISSL